MLQVNCTSREGYKYLRNYLLLKDNNNKLDKSGFKLVHLFFSLIY